MRVKAIRPGYYDLRRVKVGDIFDIPDNLFSDKWMEKLEEKSRVTGSSKAKAAPKAEAPVDDDEVI